MGQVDHIDKIKSYYRTFSHPDSLQWNFFHDIFNYIYLVNSAELHDCMTQKLANSPYSDFVIAIIDQIVRKSTSDFYFDKFKNLKLLKLLIGNKVDVISGDTFSRFIERINVLSDLISLSIQIYTDNIDPLFKLDNLPNLRYLSIYGNQTIDTIQDIIELFPNLTSLTIPINFNNIFPIITELKDTKLIDFHLFVNDTPSYIRLNEYIDLDNILTDSSIEYATIYNLKYRSLMEIDPSFLHCINEDITDIPNLHLDGDNYNPFYRLETTIYTYFDQNNLSILQNLY